VLYRLKLLIVDDEPDTREALKLVLVHSRAQVIAVATASEGLEQLHTHGPDVIISDIGMPQMDGYEFIRLMRNLPAELGGQTPAVALTAFNLWAERTRALKAGFQKHLAKPYDLQELIETVAGLAGRPLA
jgi:CheY-like chemotaxis protein